MGLNTKEEADSAWESGSVAGTDRGEGIGAKSTVLRQKQARVELLTALRNLPKPKTSAYEIEVPEEEELEADDAGEEAEETKILDRELKEQEEREQRKARQEEERKRQSFAV